MSQAPLWLIAVASLVVIVIATRFQRRWNLLRTAYRRLEEYADTLLQHGLGTILSLQGMVSDLSVNDPVRLRIEQALSRAERELAEFRDTMQPHCSEQQQDRIQ